VTLKPAFANRAAVETPPAPAPVVPSVSVLVFDGGTSLSTHLRQWPSSVWALFSWLDLSIDLPTSRNWAGNSERLHGVKQIKSKHSTWRFAVLLRARLIDHRPSHASHASHPTVTLRPERCSTDSYQNCTTTSSRTTSWSDHHEVIEQKLHYAYEQGISTFYVSLQRLPSHCQSSPAVYSCLSLSDPVARLPQRTSNLHVALCSNTHRSTYF
jgi:hypothetical protein